VTSPDSSPDVPTCGICGLPTGDRHGRDGHGVARRSPPGVREITGQAVLGGSGCEGVGQAERGPAGPGFAQFGEDRVHVSGGEPGQEGVYVPTVRTKSETPVAS
jgi:hypothetical protein